MGKRKQPDQQGTTSSAYQDEMARRAMMNREKALIEAERIVAEARKEAQSQSALIETGMFTGFGSGRVAPAPTLTPEILQEQIRKMGGPYTITPISTAVTRRDWPRMIRSFRGGVMTAADAASGGLSECWSMYQDPTTQILRYSDPTGQHEAPVEGVLLASRELEKSDGDLAEIIDESIRYDLVAQAAEMVGDINLGPGSKMSVAGLLRRVAKMHGLYPVFHISHEIDPLPSSDQYPSDQYRLRYAIAWVYDNELEDDDD